MTITREQVADLRAGDVVELRLTSGTTIRGALTDDRFAIGLGIAGAGWLIRDSGGGVAYHLDEDAESLTVISRAPRPLYVNHDREKPVPGDIVVAADGGRLMWVCRSPWVSSNPWCRVTDLIHQPRCELPPLLRLLVDGETGQVVP